MAVRHVSASDSSSEEESVSSAKMSDKAAEPAKDPVTEKMVSPFENKGEKKERSKSAGRKSRSRSRHRRRRERKDEKEKKGRKEKKDKDKKHKDKKDKERDRRGKKDKEEAPCPSASKPSRPSSGKEPDQQNREEHEEVLDTTQRPAHPKDPPKTKVEAQTHEKTKGGQKGKTGKRQCSVCHQWVGKADAAMNQHRWLNSYCLSWQMYNAMTPAARQSKDAWEAAKHTAKGLKAARAPKRVEGWPWNCEERQPHSKRRPIRASECCTCACAGAGEPCAGAVRGGPWHAVSARGACRTTRTQAWQKEALPAFKP